VIISYVHYRSTYTVGISVVDIPYHIQSHNRDVHRKSDVSGFHTIFLGTRATALEKLPPPSDTIYTD